MCPLPGLRARSLPKDRSVQVASALLVQRTSGAHAEVFYRRLFFEQCLLPEYFANSKYLLASVCQENRTGNSLFLHHLMVLHR